jgi:hypothetical protein
LHQFRLLRLLQTTKDCPIAVHKDVYRIGTLVEGGGVASVLLGELAHPPEFLDRLEANLLALIAVADPADDLVDSLLATADSASYGLVANDLDGVPWQGLSESEAMGLEDLTKLPVRDGALASGDSVDSFTEPLSEFRQECARL